MPVGEGRSVAAGSRSQVSRPLWIGSTRGCAISVGEARASCVARDRGGHRGATRGERIGASRTAEGAVEGPRRPGPAARGWRLLPGSGPRGAAPRRRLPARLPAPASGRGVRLPALAPGPAPALAPGPGPGSRPRARPRAMRIVDPCRSSSPGARGRPRPSPGESTRPRSRPQRPAGARRRPRGGSMAIPGPAAPGSSIPLRVAGSRRRVTGSRGGRPVADLFHPVKRICRRAARVRVPSPASFHEVKTGGPRRAGQGLPRRSRPCSAGQGGPGDPGRAGAGADSPAGGRPSDTRIGPTAGPGAGRAAPGGAWAPASR